MTAKPTIRLYVPQPFAKGQLLTLGEKQAHYVAHVMRGRVGEAVAVFNGEDGQWQADIADMGKKHASLRLTRQERAQIAPADIWLVFAPIKNKSDIVVEKATELGVAKIIAVYTRHGVVKSINHEKLAAHIIEAAEQCERMEVPLLEEAKDLSQLLGSWPKDRVLLHADEAGSGAALKEWLPMQPKGKYALLIGPEGGFSREEREMLARQSFVRAISLGPRILRADTAAMAGLSCLQAWLGDWEKPSQFSAQESV